jgi:glyceronephosphate O-acyltransferase
MLKPFNPDIPIARSRRSSPEEVKLRVLKSPRFNNYLDQISTDKNNRRKNVLRAIEILNEIAYSRKLVIVRTLGTVLDNLMARLYTEVNINEKSLHALKKSMGNHQTVYLPSHRSYADFMLMSYVCFSYNIEIPAIAAGMDFHGMMGLGEMLRQTGAFFMRRTFGDEFYWNIFKDYMHEVMTWNDFGLEFFVEGTRSRTCKALWPKTGLLAMSLEPYFLGEMYDLKVVPISISYEKPLEEQLFVYELLGIPKPKESTAGLFKAITSLKNKNYGKMYFDFGEQIILNEFFKGKVDKFKHASEPTYVQKLDQDELQLTTDLAHFVVRKQQEKIVMFLYNLIALAYNEHVFNGSTKPLKIYDLKRKIFLLIELFEEFGAIVAFNPHNLEDEINNTVSIHENILEISNNKSSIQLLKANTERVNRQNENTKLKGHWMSKEIMDIAVPVFSLQLYCNPTIFWLNQSAFFVLSLLGGDEVPIDSVKNDVAILRKIFIYEFVLYPGFEEEDFGKTLQYLLNLKVIEKVTDDKIKLSKSSKFNTFVLSAIAPFLNSFYLTSNIILKQFTGKEYVDKELFIAVQSFIEQEFLQGNYSYHPYTLCIELINTTILSLCNMSCLYKQKQLSATLLPIK